MGRLPCRIRSIGQLAIPSVCVLIFFLGYSSQYLFKYLEPGQLTQNETIGFNILLLCIWWSYDRACTVDPGYIPRKSRDGPEGEEKGEEELPYQRWCKKCDAVKPPRAHHCRQCGRCIPKMDHHCPWTANCVSHTTFPHFLRFVFYATLSMSILNYFLYVRAKVIWDGREMPAEDGPTPAQLVHLIILIIVNCLTLFALTVLFVSAANSLVINTTMIESWEIERHEALIERSRKLGGFVNGPEGRRVRIVRQEYPYDIGFWKNIVQGMGSSNPIAWILPFGGGPSMDTGISFETNGFENKNAIWPPIDPDRMPRSFSLPEASSAFVHNEYSPSQQEAIDAFKKRQEVDLKRFEKAPSRPFNSIKPTVVWKDHNSVYHNVNQEEDEESDGNYDSEHEQGIDGEKGWTSRSGDRLRDFGVDESEDEDEDDIPLGELLRRRRAKAD